MQNINIPSLRKSLKIAKKLKFQEYCWWLWLNSKIPVNHTDNSWLVIGFVTRLTWRVPFVEQKLLTLLEHRSSLILGGVRVTGSLVLCVCFVDRCLSFCTFYFGHCVFCPPILITTLVSKTPLMLHRSTYTR